jgi:hypothetical protein
MTCLASLLLAACAANPRVHDGAEAAARFTRPLATVLDGTWEGALAMRKPLTRTTRTAPPDRADLDIRLVIEAGSARVYLRQSGEWIEAMPGGFSLARSFTNAALSGINPPDPEPQGWIENWSILVTAIDDDSLRAEWSRVVNNLDSTAESLPTFGMAASGILKRVPR